MWLWWSPPLVIVPSPSLLFPPIAPPFHPASTCSEWWCGRVSRHTCGLTHSEMFLDHSSRWLCICRLLYILSFFYIPCVTAFLTFYFTGLELQIDCDDIPEYPQIHSTHWSHKSITHHRPSRFSSRFSLLSWRIGFWFQFYFPFFESFCLFSVLFYKIQDFDKFSFS